MIHTNPIRPDRSIFSWNLQQFICSIFTLLSCGHVVGQQLEHAMQAEHSTTFIDVLSINDQNFIVARGASLAPFFSTASIASHDNEGLLNWTYAGTTTGEVKNIQAILPSHSGNVAMFSSSWPICDVGDMTFLIFEEVDSNGNELQSHTISFDEQELWLYQFFVAQSATGYILYLEGFQNVIMGMSPTAEILWTKDVPEGYTAMMSAGSHVALIGSNQLLLIDDEGTAIDSVAYMAPPLQLADLGDGALAWISELGWHKSDADGNVSDYFFDEWTARRILAYPSGNVIVYTDTEVLFFQEDGQLINDLPHGLPSNFEDAAACIHNTQLLVVGNMKSRLYPLLDKHSHGAFTMFDPMGIPMSFTPDLALLSLQVNSFEPSGLYSYYDADLSAVVYNSGTVPIDGFWLNRMEHQGVCGSSVNSKYFDSYLMPGDSVTVHFGLAQGFAMGPPVDGNFLAEVCLFLTCPDELIDRVFDNNEQCVELLLLSNEDARAASAKTLGAFPNPSLGEFRLSGVEGRHVYTVHDLLGNVLQQGVIEGNATIELSTSTAAGIYILKLDDGRQSKLILLGE